MTISESERVLVRCLGIQGESGGVCLIGAVSAKISLACILQHMTAAGAARRVVVFTGRVGWAAGGGQAQEVAVFGVIRPEAERERMMANILRRHTPLPPQFQTIARVVEFPEQYIAYILGEEQTTYLVVIETWADKPEEADEAKRLGMFETSAEAEGAARTWVERDIPNTKEIKLFFHCELCLAEKPADLSPTEWKDLEVGWTELGLQVWCRRHNANVIHIDFEGLQHSANTTRQRPQDEDIPDSFVEAFEDEDDEEEEDE